MATNEEITTARAELEAKHADVMESLGDVWVKVEAVRTSSPTDNLHDLLEELADVVDKARDGGLFGSGANSHRRALKDWQELTEPDEG